MLLPLTLRQLTYFRTAAELGSVTAAAEQLGVSQPAVSNAVAQLEAHYGRALLIRRQGKGVALTSFGDRVLRRARGLLDEAEALGALHADLNAPQGDVTLCCFEDLAPYYLPALLAHTSEVLPLVRVNFREAGFDAIEQALKDSSIDLALTFDLALPEQVGRLVLKELHPYAFLPRHHRLAHRRKVSLADLAAEPLILSAQPYSAPHILEIFHFHGLWPDVRLRCGSTELQRAFVARDYGVGLGYSRPASALSYDGTPLVYLPLSDTVPAQRLVLAHPGAAPMSQAAAAWREVAQGWFEAESGKNDRQTKSDI